MQELLLVYAAFVVGAGSPGPSNMAIMSTAMRSGRRPALALAAGVITMSACWGLVAATGVSTLLANYAYAITVLKVGGGLYLLWLGWKAARSAATPNKPTTVGAAMPPPSMWLQYRRGVLMHLGNPKSVLTWVAIMSLGLNPGTSHHMVALAYTGCVLLGATIFSGYALLFSAGPMVRGYVRARRWIEGFLAVFFAYAGIRLILAT